MNTRRLVLNTHVWLWLASGTLAKLRLDTRKAPEQARVSNPLLVLINCVWELALLESKKRLRLTISVHEWVERALDRPDIRVIGLEHPRTVIDSCRLLGDFHSDPTDPLVVATARRANAVLLTHDRKILGFGANGHVRAMAA